MKKFYLIIPLALIFSACGGGGDSASFSDAQTQITIVDCNNTNPQYTNIEDKDVLVKDSQNTQITIIHDSNNTKKVCVISGSAHLVRE